jgi:hypothetical protein
MKDRKMKNIKMKNIEMLFIIACRDFESCDATIYNGLFDTANDQSTAGGGTAAFGSCLRYNRRSRFHFPRHCQTGERP